jgi:uncharacterized protein
MFINIYKIEPAGQDFDEPVLRDVAGDEAGGGARVLEARLSGQAKPGKRGVDLRAHLEARVALECSRCLEPLETTISTDFYLNLVPDGAEFGVGEAELSEEAASLFYATEGKADLGVIAAEQLHLNLPLKPVCGDGCKGHCPTCGGNRNRIECGCREEEIDPRLAPLLEFKKRKDGA